MAITDEVLNELLKDYQKPEDLLGKEGLFKQLQKRLLEKAMGVCAEASIPPGLRWIPKGMTLDYPAKAATDLTGIARIDPAGWAPGELPVEVTAYDRDQTVVVRGTILLWISEKKHPPGTSGQPVKQPGR